MNESEVQTGAAESSSQQKDEIPYLDGIGLLKEMNSANVVVIVSIVSASVVLLLVAVVIGILLCRKNRKQTGTDKYGHNNKSSPDSGYPANDSDSHNNLLSSNEQKAFYENLPFHGLNPPGKKVEGTSVFDPKDEDMIYADTDYKDLYDFGPVSYHTVSKEAAEKKKEDVNARFKAAITYSSRTNVSTAAAGNTSNGNCGNPSDNSGNSDSTPNGSANGNADETSKQPDE